MHYTTCQNWTESGGRCRNEAEVMLYAPDGRKVPGGWECSDCASRVINEYRDKLGEEWFALPLDTSGNPVLSADKLRYKD
jgi:hypothetical protein